MNPFKLFVVPFLVLFFVMTNLQPSYSAQHAASFTDFDRKARNGEPLDVVFFGASLTWGANASNPLLTSYRANVSRKFEATYPKAHFKFHDAAIGGTGSQLGVFRLERDVLRRNPDLVFLDFSANDDIYGDDAETLASYESLVRRLVQKNIPVVQMIFPFQWNIKAGEIPKMKRRTAHLKISRSYNTAAGDAVSLATQRVLGGLVKMETVWPFDGVHPGDKGYEMFAEAAWNGFQNAVEEGKICRAPQAMLYPSTYMKSARVRISQLGVLPAGWKARLPNRTSAYFDFLMSRWLDDVVIASSDTQVERLRFKFNGSMLMLFGESTLQSGKYRVYLDGKLVERKVNESIVTEFDPGAFGKVIGGNGHHVQVIAIGLATNTMHTLEIEPAFTSGTKQELRMESICVAGGTATVEPMQKP